MLTSVYDAHKNRNNKNNDERVDRYSTAVLISCAKNGIASQIQHWNVHEKNPDTIVEWEGFTLINTRT